jgi:hypothetical protein
MKIDLQGIQEEENTRISYLFLFQKCGLVKHFVQYSKCMYQCLKLNDP